MNIKKTMIIMTITVVVLTLLTTVLMLSTSGTAPIKLYWAVDCNADETNCNLKISGINFIGEEESNESNVTAPVNNFTDSGSITVDEQIEIDKPTKVAWYKHRNKITSVTLGADGDVIVPANMYAWFYGMEKLENIDFSYVDSSSITDASYLFYGCSSIRTLDLSPLRIPYQVAGISDNVYTYTYIDSITTSTTNYLRFEFGFWKKEGSTTEYYANSVPTGEDATYKNVTPKFYYHIEDGTLNITSTQTSGYDWNYEGSANEWFDRYTGELKSNITKVVVKNFAPRTMHRLFADLTSVTSIEFARENNISTVDTSNTMDMIELFYNCKKLVSLDLSDIDTRESVFPASTESDLFINCSSLKSITINEKFGYSLNEGIWVDSENHAYIDGAIPTNVNETYTRRELFWGIKNNTLTISNNYVPGDHKGTFDYLGYSGSHTQVPWITYASSVTAINIGGPGDYIQPITMSGWFQNFSEVVNLDLSYLDTSKVTEMNSTFARMSKLKSIDLSGLNFDNLEEVDNLFGGCTSLEDVNLEGFNPPMLTGIGAMFYDCSSLEEIDLSSLEGPYLNSIASLFDSCTSLKRIMIPNLIINPANFGEEEDYVDVFYGCDKISQITVGPTNVGFVKAFLGNPNPDYIEGADDGLWHDYSENPPKSYDISNLPEDKIGTYYATSPVELIIYDSETNSILKQGKYAYGSKVKLNVNSTKPNEVTPITTKFVTSSEQVIDDIVTNKTVTYALSGYTDNTTNYDYGSSIVLKADTTLYTVYSVDSTSYETVTLPEVTRFGYIFKVWSKEPNQTTGMNAGYAYPAETNETLYAVWEEIKHNYIKNPTEFKIGKTKSLVFQIDADLELFRDLYIIGNGNTTKLIRDTHYTATSGSTVITFTEAGISYLETLEPAEYTLSAEFADTVSGTTTKLRIKDKNNLLIIHYRYSGSRSEEEVFPDYSGELENGQQYSIPSQTKEHYRCDKEVVSGTMGKNDIVVTVTYTPINDKDKNDTADEEDPVPEPTPSENTNNNTNNNTSNNTNTNSNTNQNTNSNTNNEASPKTRDNILTYIILEIVSLVAAVVIFIRIKAQ